MFKMNKKKFVYQGREFSYIVSKNKLSKKAKISICHDCLVRVSLPFWMPSIFADGFVNEKADWILKNIDEMEKRLVFKLGEDDYLKNKKEARNFILKRIEEYNNYYGFKIHKIQIRNQRTRWGSCSSKGNLNFSYKVLFLPLDLADYVVVHELCHLGELNHSEKFWQLVGKTIEDYREKRVMLKNYQI